MKQPQQAKVSHAPQSKDTPVNNALTAARSRGSAPRQLQSVLGNHAVGRLLQAKLRVSKPGDAFEEEADRAAEQVLQMPDARNVQAPSLRRVESSHIQRACAKCEDEEHLHRKSDDASVDATLQAKGAGESAGGTSTAIEAGINRLGHGTPLADPVRAYFEPRFGRDFSDVRVHTGQEATQAAHAANALAFTVGKELVFGAGQFRPETGEGKKLLAHELAHTVQQGAATDTVFRQHEGDDIERLRQMVGPLIPPLVNVPATGLTFIPGPLTATLPGTRIPIPASLRLTNAFNLGPGLAAPSIPSFVVDLSPRMFVAHLLENIDLSTSATPGTPPGAENLPENISRVSLLNPTIYFNPATRRLSGTATLSVASSYPAVLHAPNEFSVTFDSTELGAFSGSLGYGPAHLDFTLNLHYDTARLEQALRPAFAPQGGFDGFWQRFQIILRQTIPNARFEGVSEALQLLLRSLISGNIRGEAFAARTLELIASSIPEGVSPESVRTAVTQFANEMTHPGFTAGGTLRIGSLPISTFSAVAPTTVPLARP
ncbi:MAG: DUF4157 domain-containing protein, partial [Pyrinomonadaceae bacterium]